MAAGAFAQSEPDAASTDWSSAQTDSSSATQNASPPNREQCIDAHRKAQQFRNEGKLVESRELARTCTSLVCPGLVISDCSAWLSDLDERIPSVVFEVRVNGEPDATATVTADGTRVNEWTRGEALRMNPGEHEFRIELEPYEPIIRKLLLAEGMRYRVVPIEFKPEASETRARVRPEPTRTLPPAAPEAPVRARPTPVIVYPLLGLGVVGVGGFAVFGALGNKEESDLEETCEPDCSDSEVRAMKRDYLLGDISLGVGAASLITAGIIYLVRPEEPVSTTVGFAPLPGGGATFASYRF
jgi:hypothetical protein